MSNRAPKINPTGTRFSKVIVPHFSHEEGRYRLSVPSKAYKNMMRVVGEYIKADYVVKYQEDYILDLEEYRKTGQTKHILAASVSCTPPLFPEERPQT